MPNAPQSNVKRILITGATRGLGRAMCEGFIASGHTVIGCGRNAKHVDELRQRWPKAHGFDVVDVVDDSAVETWAENVLPDGPIDLLLNNAAVVNANSVLWNVSADEFDRVIDVKSRASRTFCAISFRQWSNAERA